MYLFRTKLCSGMEIGLSFWVILVLADESSLLQSTMQYGENILEHITSGESRFERLEGSTNNCGALLNYLNVEMSKK